MRGRWLTLPAGVRLALLAAALTLVAVLGSVLPVVLDADYQARALQEAAVAEALRAASVGLEGPEDLAPLVEATAFQGALLREGGALKGRVGDIDDLRAGRCPPLGPGQLRSVVVDTQRVSCLGLSGDRAVLAVTTPRIEPARAARRQRLLITGLAFACLAAGLVGGALQRLLQPLGAMAEQARGLAHGGAPAPVPVPEDPALRPLAEALDQLGATLASREDDIQQRLHVVQQLTAVVAHEVRNPLQSLLMLTDVVAHADDPDERQELLQAIRQELGLIEVVVARLVGSGDRLRLARRPTSLGDLLARCVRLQRPEASSLGVDLDLDASPELEGELDGPLLRRAVENLIRNAVAAGGPGHRVRLRLEPLGPGVAAVHVDDDGPGVPEHRRAAILEPGVSDRPGGTGLGLPLARMVAEAHGGSLEVGRSPEGGARFTLTLPLRPAEPAP